MVISRKRTPSLPRNLTLGGSDLERVQCFKYLGLLLSANLSFTEHIQSSCSKARKILELLYRRFYNNTNGAALLQLYQSLVRPHLWNPHIYKEVELLQNVEKFALQMVTKRWDTGKFVHNLCSFCQTSLHLDLILV